MAEKRADVRWGEPEHSTNAQRFIEFIDSEIRSNFPSVKLSTMNVTENTIENNPKLAKKAREEKLFDLANDLESDGMTEDIESVLSTRIRVTTYSDTARDIDQINEILSHKAHQLNGEVIVDTSTEKSKRVGFLDKLLGHPSDYSRIVDYKFT